MRLSSVLSCLFIFLVPVTGNAQNHHWAWAGGGYGGSEGWAVCTDPWGNVFGAGFPYGASVSFGSTVLSGFGTRGAIVVKYDAAGNLIWANGTQNGTAGPIDIAADDAGNLYLYGFNQSSSVTIGTVVLTNADSTQTDLFIAKYSPSGNVLWAKNIGDVAPGWLSGFSYSGGIVTHEGAIFITAPYFDSVASIGSFVLTNTDPSGNTADLFISKMDGSGNVLWVKAFGGNATDISEDIAITPLGNIYITGSFYSSELSFGATSLSCSPPSSDIFVAKFDNSGNPIWAKSSAGGGAAVSAVATDLQDNAFIVGSYYGSFSLGSINIAAPASTAAFVAKYLSDGSVDWVKNINGNTELAGYDVAVDACENVWMSGGCGYDMDTISNSIDIDGHVISVPAAGTDPMFVIGLTNSGGYLDGVSLPTGGDDLNGIGTDGAGNVYIGGDYFQSPFTLGSTTLVDSPFTGENLFVAKYALNAVVDSHSVKTTNVCVLDSITLYAPAGFLYYSWYDGTGGLTHEVHGPGTYWVQCTGNCEQPLETDTFTVINGPVDLSFTLGHDTTLCGDLTLQVPVSGVSYQWQDGSAGSSYTATSGGTYYVTVEDKGCSYTDSIVITNGDGCSSCEIGIPNAFTPNENGLNDYFHPVIAQGCQFSNYTFSIYNRWGQRIFTTHDKGAKWDGTYLGQMADVGTYMYTLDYSETFNNSHHFRKGDVTLIR